MARKIDAFIRVEGVLRASTGVHVGGSGGDLVADMPLARDGAGNFYIPGTSLAGPMRRWWADRFDRRSAELFFGRTPTATDKSEGHASFIVVGDGTVTGVDTETRDGVSIDANTGAAREGFKFDREILPPGSEIGLHLRYDASGATQAQDGERKFATLVKALEEGAIRFGAGKSRGLGVLKLASATAKQYEVGKRAGMLGLLNNRVGNDDKIDRAFDYANEALPIDTGNRLVVHIAWESRLPVFNLGAGHGAAADHAPLLSGTGDDKRQTIAGSSIKGALRSHAARICRTIAGEKDATTDPELVVALFGAPAARAKTVDPDDDDAPKRPGAGALGVDDCLIGGAISATEYENALKPEGEKPDIVSGAQRRLDAIAAARDGGWRIAEHVAIDRWTGGAAENLLFNVLEPGRGQRGEFKLTLDFDRIAFADPSNAESGRLAALALFLLLIRDLAEGRIPIGFGATRGGGSLRATSIEFASVGQAFADLGFAAGLDVDSMRDKTAFAAFGTLADAWAKWSKPPTAGGTGS